MPILLLIGIGVAVFAAALVATWTKVLDWVRKDVLPWLTRFDPELAQQAKEALVLIDVGVARVRRAWTVLRAQIVKSVVEFAQKSNNEWLIRTITWLKVGPKEVQERMVERTVPFHELPDEVRAEWVRRNQSEAVIDVVETRNQELEMELR
jgi:hypothetical protein